MVDEKIHHTIDQFPQRAVAGSRRRYNRGAGLKRSFAEL
jgi:hypothetical protein